MLLLRKLQYYCSLYCCYGSANEWSANTTVDYKYCCVIILHPCLPISQFENISNSAPILCVPLICASFMGVNILDRDLGFCFFANLFSNGLHTLPYVSHTPIPPAMLPFLRCTIRFTCQAQFKNDHESIIHN